MVNNLDFKKLKKEYLPTIISIKDIEINIKKFATVQKENKKIKLNTEL
jgi:hypothetical protein